MSRNLTLYLLLNLMHFKIHTLISILYLLSRLRAFLHYVFYAWNTFSSKNFYLVITSPHSCFNSGKIYDKLAHSTNRDKFFPVLFFIVNKH